MLTWHTFSACSFGIFQNKLLFTCNLLKEKKKRQLISDMLVQDKKYRDN